MKKQIDVPALLSMLLPMLALIALMFVMSGCSGKVGIGIDAACGQWTTITASRQDTQQTIDEIYLNNVKREAFCYGT